MDSKSKYVKIKMTVKQNPTRRISMRIFAFADEADSQFDGQIAAMLRNGLDGLEIRGVDGTNISDITLEKAAELRKKMDDANLIVWSIGSPIGKISIHDPFEPHLEKFKHTLEIAKILGASNIRLFSFYVTDEEKTESCKAEVISRLKQLVAAAEGTGITLCHENEKGIYGSTAAHCLELFQAIPQLKGIFDPANFVQCEEDTLEAWALLGNYIKYLHIKDAAADGMIVPAGQGAGHISEIIEKYSALGGSEMTLEPHLKVFEGLKDIEQEGNTSEVGHLSFPTNDAAFDAGCQALKALL